MFFFGCARVGLIAFFSEIWEAWWIYKGFGGFLRRVLEKMYCFHFSKGSSVDFAGVYGGSLGDVSFRWLL